MLLRISNGKGESEREERGERVRDTKKGGEKERKT